MKFRDQILIRFYWKGKKKPFHMELVRSGDKFKSPPIEFWRKDDVRVTATNITRGQKESIRVRVK